MLPPRPPPGSPHDDQLQADVYQMVLSPLLHKDKDPPRYHPIIQSAYDTLIQTLVARDGSRSLPSLKVLAYCVDNLQRFSELADESERPLTPSRNNTNSADALVFADTPRSTEAKSKARILATKLGDP
ncbi:hypothetical protein [Sporisorium scitamineum]|uniref:Uncharacterized protein n=1 Tax=Sporisorium scitamineum TaxID=49012 RepID=A0A0F7SA59_9BASI|nr:hypothetical protein [Sporisorium scitamineum]